LGVYAGEHETISNFFPYPFRERRKYQYRPIHLFKTAVYASYQNPVVQDFFIRSCVVCWNDGGVLFIAGLGGKCFAPFAYRQVWGRLLNSIKGIALSCKEKITDALYADNG
jgi:hypothetical protein